MVNREPVVSSRRKRVRGRLCAIPAATGAGALRARACFAVPSNLPRGLRGLQATAAASGLRVPNLQPQRAHSTAGVAAALPSLF